MSDPLAQLSQAAYSHRDVPGYTRDTELSSQDWDVYRNDATGKATISFRGTSTNPFKGDFYRDLGADMATFFGAQKINNRYKRVDRVTQQVINKYGGVDNVEVTGHSLGGAEAAYVSDKYKVKATTYNALVTPADIIKNRAGKTDWSNVTQNITFGDPISISGMGIKGGKRNVDYEPIKQETIGIAKDVGYAVLYAGAAAATAAAFATGVGEVAALGAGAAFAAEGAEAAGIAFEGSEALTTGIRAGSQIAFQGEGAAASSAASRFTASELAGSTASELEPLLSEEGGGANVSRNGSRGPRQTFSDVFKNKFNQKIKDTVIPTTAVDTLRFGYDTANKFHSINNFTDYPDTIPSGGANSHTDSNSDLVFPSQSGGSSYPFQMTSYGTPLYTGQTGFARKKAPSTVAKKHKRHKKKKDHSKRVVRNFTGETKTTHARTKRRSRYN